MTDQSHYWSRVAPSYEEEFVDPYRSEVRSPLRSILDDLADPRTKVVADLGCGIGPLLPFLAARFRKVFAVDFAEGMLLRAQERCRDIVNIEFVQARLTELTALAGQVDVAVAVNSLVMPSITDLETSLCQIRSILRPGGVLVGIVPAMDSVHYLTMLLVDRALAAGKPLDAARKSAAHFNDHAMYDFAFGQFRFQGIEQHFWQPFEVPYRLKRAGFQRIHLCKILLAWDQFAWGNDFREYLPPWDWFFEARCPLAPG